MPKNVAGVMKEFAAGTLHSGSKSGPKVTSRKQALAIGMSEQAKLKGGKKKRGGIAEALEEAREKAAKKGTSRIRPKQMPMIDNTDEDDEGY